MTDHLSPLDRTPVKLKNYFSRIEKRKEVLFTISEKSQLTEFAKKASVGYFQEFPPPIGYLKLNRFARKCRKFGYSDDDILKLVSDALEFKLEEIELENEIR